jgi:glutathione S-transferase
LSADIATFCWVVLAPLIGIKLTEFPNLKTWHDKIWARPAVQAGCSIPEGTLERVQGIMNV